jgi:hypothetical protein
MRLSDGSVFLSPSDVTGYLACPHLTTLELAVARGELNNPRPPSYEFGEVSHRLYEFVGPCDRGSDGRRPPRASGSTRGSRHGQR